MGIGPVRHIKITLDKKNYFLTLKYIHGSYPIEIVLKERKTGKIVYKSILIKRKWETRVSFERFEKLLMTPEFQEKLKLYFPTF